MLDSAFDKYNDLKGLVFHSDQGWQYQMFTYHKVLIEKGIVQSISLMENFFGVLKREMFYGHEFEFETLEQLQLEIEEYIDYYNDLDSKQN